MRRYFADLWTRIREISRTVLKFVRLTVPRRTRRLHRRLILRGAAELREHLACLQTFEPDMRARLASPLRHHLNRLALRVFSDNLASFGWIGLTCGPLIMLPIVLPLVLLWRSLGIPALVSGLAWKVWPATFYLYFSGVFFCTVTAFPVLGRSLVRSPYGRAWARFVVSLACLGAFALVRARLRIPMDFGLGSLFAWVGAHVLLYLGLELLVFVICLAYLFPFADGIARRRSEARTPDASMMMHLLSALCQLEGKPACWCGLRFKRDLMAKLERVAVLMERSLPKRLRTSDALSDGWVSRRGAEMAAAVRDLKKWICAPRSDTQVLLKRRLDETLSHVALGEWDEIARAKPESWTARKWSTITRSLCRIPLAVAPGAALLAVQHTDFALSDSLADYAKVGAIIWFLSVLFTTSDESFSDRIARARGLLDLFRGRGRPDR